MIRYLLKLQGEQQKSQQGKGGQAEPGTPQNFKDQITQQIGSERSSFFWLDWIMDSQFRNVFIFSFIAAILMLISTIINLFNKKSVGVSQENTKDKKSKKANKEKNQ